MKFTEVSIFIKIALVVIALMFLFDIIGFATNSWIGIGSTHAGLWEGCNSYTCQKMTNMQSDFEAAQAMEVLGFIAALAALVVIILYLFVPPLADKDILKMVTMILCFVACFFILIGVIIYSSTDYKKRLNVDYRYSFVLTIIAGILALAGGILIVVDKVM